MRVLEQLKARQTMSRVVDKTILILFPPFILRSDLIQFPIYYSHEKILIW